MEKTNIDYTTISYDDYRQVVAYACLRGGICGDNDDAFWFDTLNDRHVEVYRSLIVIDDHIVYDSECIEDVDRAFIFDIKNTIHSCNVITDNSGSQELLEQLRSVWDEFKTGEARVKRVISNHRVWCYYKTPGSAKVIRHYYFPDEHMYVSVHRDNTYSIYVSSEDLSSVKWCAGILSEHTGESNQLASSKRDITRVLMAMCQKRNARGYTNACALIGNALNHVLGDNISDVAEALEKNFL